MFAKFVTSSLRLILFAKFVTISLRLILFAKFVTSNLKKSLFSKIHVHAERTLPYLANTPLTHVRRIRAADEKSNELSVSCTPGCDDGMRAVHALVPLY